MAVTRRRSSRDNEPDEERDERPTRRRRASGDDAPEEERPTRRRRSRDEDEEDEKPTRSRRSRSRDEDEDEPDERPRRSRRRSGDEDSGRTRRSGTRGFGSYSSKKRSSGDYATEFKPKDNDPVLIKILDEEPFDSYNQHWIDEMGQGERKSYCCLDDPEYFGEAAEDGCPLDDIGDVPKTFALFNILDLSNPRKPENKVWAASPAVADILERAAKDKKSSPLNREDLYFEVEKQKKGKRYSWNIVPVKARDLQEDFDMDPLEADELEEFSENLYTDRTAVTKIDSYDDLAEIADSL